MVFFFYFLEGKTYEFYKWICGGVHLIFFCSFCFFFFEIHDLVREILLLL